MFIIKDQLYISVHNKKCLHPAVDSGINLTCVGHSQFFQANLSIFEQSSWKVIGFAAGKVCRNRMGSTAKRLMKIHKMETQNWDGLLNPVDRIWDKWTRNKVNVKILIWVILLRWLYQSDKFWSNCPQKAAATCSTGGVKALWYIWNGTEKPHYYYLYYKKYESLSYFWRPTQVYYFQSDSGNHTIFPQRGQSIYYFTAKGVWQISLWLRVKWRLPEKKNTLNYISLHL